jgi:hypothetical protein
MVTYADILKYSIILTITLIFISLVIRCFYFGVILHSDPIRAIDIKTPIFKMFKHEKDKKAKASKEALS